MIKLVNVNKYFNRRRKNEIHVINNVNLTFEDNGLVALLGPSGSGKTTLLNAIGGLDKVAKGKIYINKKRITKKTMHSVDKIRNINIGYIFQDYKLLEDLNVFDNVAIVLKLLGIKDKKEIKTRVEYVLNSVNMYRYRNRPVSMLSGGERQRVAIARAIVKDPDIIIADEPTGNLDSNNTIQIMNIIKAISKNRLVILVTHETELAKFYASRIIELKDGKVQKDYKNDIQDELDYRLENKIFLKDLEKHEQYKKDTIDINCYSDNKEDLKINVILKDGHIYIQSENNRKIEVIDQNSNIELVNEHYKKIDKKVYQEYDFNFDEKINKNLKKKYSSILNPITLIKKGFKKIFALPLLKRLLLIGFVVSGLFTMYSVSSILGTLKIKESDFVEVNRSYLQIIDKQLKVEEYLQYEKYPEVNYLLPGNSHVFVNFLYDDYYQISGFVDRLKVSVASKELIEEDNLIYGEMIQNNREVILDKMIIDVLFMNDNAKMSGILDIQEVIGKEINIPYMDEFKIVGIVDTKSPSIYVEPTEMINIIANSSSDSHFNIFGIQAFGIKETNEEYNQKLFDFKLYEDKIQLKEGKFPINDYEVIVNISNKYSMPLNKEIDIKVNDKKLKVVGYYDSKENIESLLVNNNTIKYKLITENEIVTVSSSNKEITMNKFKENNINIEDSFEYSKKQYLNQQRESRISTLVVAGIIFSISLVEIYLMIRSSFLSRIKEIGIYRAIGVKKSDIYKMFAGEIIAITTLGILPGILIMAYILNTLTGIKYISNFFVINIPIIICTIAFVYVFDIVIGLIPVFNVIRKRPAEILSRNDLE